MNIGSLLIILYGLVAPNIAGSGDFLLLDGTDFLLLDATNFLLFNG